MPGGKDKDDGRLVTYVFDENTNELEVNLTTKPPYDSDIL